MASGGDATGFPAGKTGPEPVLTSASVSPPP